MKGGSTAQYLYRLNSKGKYYLHHHRMVWNFRNPVDRPIIRNLSQTQCWKFGSLANVEAGLDSEFGQLWSDSLRM